MTREEFISEAKARGKSKEETYAKFQQLEAQGVFDDQQPTPEPAKSGLDQRIDAIGKQAAAGEITDVEGGLRAMGEAARPINEGIAGTLAKVMGPFGKAVNWGADQVLKRPGLATSPLAIPALAAKSLPAVQEKVGEAWQGFEKIAPRAAADIGAVGQIAGVASLPLIGVPLGKAGAATGLKGAGTAAESIGKNALQGSMKIKDTTARLAGKTTDEGAKAIVENISKYDVEGDYNQIAAKSDKKIAEAKQAADAIIDDAVKNNPSAKVDVDNVILKFMDDVENGKIDALFGSEDRAIQIANDLSQSLEKRGIVGEVDLAQANKAKRLLGSRAFKKGAFGIAEDPVSMQVKEMLDLRMRDEIRNIVPEIDKHNRTMHDLITVRRAAQEAEKRVGNRNIVGLGDILTGISGVGVAQVAGNPLMLVPTAGALIGKKLLERGRGASGLISAGKGMRELGERMKK